MEHDKARTRTSTVRLTIQEIKKLPPELQREIKGAIRLQEIMRSKAS